MAMLMSETGPLGGFWKFARRRPWVAGPAMFVLATLGFLWATFQRNIWWGIILALVSIGLGAIGLLVLNAPISEFVNRNVRRGGILGWFGLAVGAVIAYLAARWEISWLAIVGSIIGLLALLAINAWLLKRGQKKPLLFVALGLALTALAVLMIRIGDGLDGLSIAAVIPWIIGLVVFKVGLPAWLDEAIPRRRGLVLGGAIAATVVGVLLLVYAGRNFSEAPLLFGLALPILGLSSVGIASHRYDMRGFRADLFLGLGLGALVVGLWWGNQVAQSAGITFAVALILAGIGAWFVFRGEGLMAVLLIGLVLGWVLVDRNSDDPPNPDPDAAIQLAAFGDSFISGEGARRYLEGTNVVGDGGNQCRRSATAHPYVVAERLDAGLTFLACSGAKSNNMNATAPLPGGAPDNPDPGDDQVGVLRALAAEGPLDFDAVLVSVGGNDVGFGTIIQACLLPGNCAADGRGDEWLANVRQVRPVLKDTYLNLKEVVGDDTPIVAVPYPRILRADKPSGCSVSIVAEEFDFVVDFTIELNAVVEAAAADAGINVYTGSVEAFRDNLLCDDDPATNWLHLSPTDGPVAQRLFPGNWVHGSMHPRASGHALLADGLVSADGSSGFLKELLDSVAAGGPANPEPQDDTPSGESLNLVPDDDFVNERLYETVGALIPPVALVLVGGLLTAIGILGNGWWQILRPTNIARPGESDDDEDNHDEDEDEPDPT